MKIGKKQRHRNTLKSGRTLQKKKPLESKGRVLQQKRPSPIKEEPVKRGTGHHRADYTKKHWLLHDDVSFEPVKYPHFRGYYSSGHPALILSEKGEDEFAYRKVMSSEKDGRHLNEKIFPNPDKKQKTPMYIGKRTRSDKKENFTEWHFTWKYPKKK